MCTAVEHLVDMVADLSDLSEGFFGEEVECVIADRGDPFQLGKFAKCPTFFV